MAIRPLHTDLKNHLMDNKPYVSAHLIKFEKPTLSPNYSGVSARKSTDYTYITDSPYNLEFDDGSYSRQQQFLKEKQEFQNVTITASPNGSQMYFANKVVKVGTINEGISAKASNLTLELDASALGSLAHTECTFTGVGGGVLTTAVDLSEKGFTEGDKIYLDGGAGANNGLCLRLDSFISTGINVTVLSGTWTVESNVAYSISLLSEEITTLLVGDGQVSYTNYINREVAIYRIYIDPETNQVIGGMPSFTGATYDAGGAVLLFKGIITNASLDENPVNKSTMKWTLSSHWGDFIRVQNRLTHDGSHRALDVTGNPDYNMLLRKEYATDLGFEHADRSLNLVSTYNRTETRTKLKKKKKNFGLSKKYTMTEYEVQVPTDVDLKINMHSKHLPVVYGVQRVDSIPVFFDNLKDASDQIYVNYAIAEGKIGGILDFVIDDKGMLCTDLADEQVRGTQDENNTVDQVCEGRQDRGDCLEGTNIDEGVGIYTQHTYKYKRPVFGHRNRSRRSSGITNAPIITKNKLLVDAGGVGTKGIVHEEAFRIQDPIDGTFIFYNGDSAQRASDLLVEKADKGLFKIQQDFYQGELSDYYTPNHRLLDTAYITAEYLVSEGEISIPSIDFVVRGKEIECYNYDQSYQHNSGRYPSQSPAHFNAGNTVSLYYDGSSTSNSATIIDKFVVKNTEGVDEFRFRWDITIPDSVSEIRMSNGTNDWNMVVSDKLLSVGDVPEALEASVATYGTANGNVQVEFTNASLSTAYNAAVSAEDTFIRNGVAVTEAVAKVSPFPPTNIGAANFNFINRTASATTTTVEVPSIEALDINEVPKVSIKNAVVLDSSLSSISDNRFVGANIILVKHDSDNVPYTQVRKITKFITSGGEAIAFVDEPWDPDYIPDNTFSYQIRNRKDLRVSTNPAMQLMDYMKSKRYGKGLDDDDIDLDSFKAAAVSCDTRSDISIIVPAASAPPAESIYKYQPGAMLLWQGTVKSVSSSFDVNGTAYKEVVFTDCIGKLLSKWTDYRSYATGTILWDHTVSSSSLKVTNQNGVVSDLSALSDLGSLSLQRSGGASGPTTVAVDIGVAGRSADGNPIIKAKDISGGVSASGYSLYDSDNIKYWRFIGWDAHVQRNVTRHQFNQTIDTGNTVFDNINSMLEQFNGVLRYSSGKYQLQVKRESGAFTAEEQITEADIVGQIKLSDKGSKKTYNSISANIIDPANNFEPRSISFFNSQYLKQDNGVPKKGSFDTPSITNYYNARVNIQQFLEESRNGLEIQMKLRPSAVNLLAGEVFSFTYPRFGWDSKLFRITNLNFMADGLVSLTAEEHSNDAYLIISKEEDDGTSVSKDQSPGSFTGLSPVPTSPFNLLATQSLENAIRLSWQHAMGYNKNTHFIEIFRNSINVRNTSLAAVGALNESADLTVSSTANVAVGMVVTGLTSSFNVNSGSFVPGTSYTIQDVGNNNWNTIAGTSGINYQRGDLITPVVGQTGSGSETGVLKTLDEEVTVSAIPSSTEITLSHASVCANNAPLSFSAPKIATLKDTNTYDDILSGAANFVDFYYWIRYSVEKLQTNVISNRAKFVNSNFFPATNTGVSGRGKTPSYSLPRAIDISLNNSGHFLYNNAGSQIESTIGTYPTSTTFTVTPSNTVGTLNYKFEVFNQNGVLQNTLTQSGASNTFTFNAPTGAASANGLDLFPQSVKVTLTDTIGSDVFTATETVSMTASRVLVNGQPGADAITIDVPNANHVFATDSSNNIIFTGSGTDLAVFEGDDELSYVDIVEESIDIQLIQAATQYIIRNLSSSNMSTSDWNTLGASTVAEGQQFTSANQSTINNWKASNSTKTGTIAFNRSPTSFADISANQYFIQTSFPSGVTAASGGFSEVARAQVQGAPNFAQLGDYTGFTITRGDATFTVKGKRSDATQFTKVVSQGLSRTVNAKTTKVVVDDPIIEYDEDGAILAAQSVTVSATHIGVEDPYFTITAVDSASSPTTTTIVNNVQGSTASGTFSVPAAITSLPVTITCDVKEGGAGNAVASDSTVLIPVQDAPKGRGVKLEAAKQVFEYTSAGTITAQTTTITANPSNTTGTVSYNFFIDGNAAAGANVNGAVLTYTPDASVTNMPQIVKVQLVENSTVVAEDFITIIGIQAGASGANARNVAITTDRQVFKYQSNETTLVNSGHNTATLTASTTGFTGTETFEFFENGTTMGSASATATKTINVSTSSLGFADFPRTYEVKAYENGTEKASDILTLIAVRDVEDGVDTINAVLSNETHAITVAADNTVTHTGSGTSIQVFKGTTALTPKKTSGAAGTGQFKVTAVNGTNITPNSLNGAGYTISGTTLTIADHSGFSHSSTNANIEYTISVEGTSTITKTQTFSRSKEGEDGVDTINILFGNESHTIPVSNTNTVTHTGTGTTIQVLKGTTALTPVKTGTPTASQFKVTAVNGTNITPNSLNAAGYTISGNTLTVGDHSGFAHTSTTGEITYTIQAGSTTGLTKKQTFARSLSGTDGNPGVSAIAVALTNGSHNVQVDNSLTPNLTGSGTKVYVNEGATALTYDATATAFSDLSAGEFFVEVASNSLTFATTKVTAGTGNGFAIVADYTGMSANEVLTQITVKGKRADGTTFTELREQSLTKVFPTAAVKLLANNYTAKFDDGTNPVTTSSILSTTIFGLDSSAIHYNFITDMANSAAVESAQASGGLTLQLGSTTIASYPITIKVQVREGTNTSPASPVVLAEDSITISALRDGAAVSIVASNATFNFDATTTGETVNNFVSNLKVNIGGTDFSYDGASPYAANSFRYGTPTAVDCLAVNPFPADGTISLQVNGINTTQTSTLAAALFIPVINNNTGVEIGTMPFSFTKTLDQETAENRAISGTALNGTQSADWLDGSTALTTNTCDAVVSAVLALSGVSALVPGDRVTYDSTAGGTGTVATRIYKGVRRTSTNATGSGNADWSSIVTEKIDGSAIVDGTLSVGSFTANSAFTQSLSVHNNLTIGSTDGGNVDGSIRSYGKDDFTDNDAGFFMGMSSGTPQFYLGTNSENIKFDGTNISMTTSTGNFTYSSAPQNTASRIVIEGDKIRIFEGSQERVRIGNLTGF